MSPTLPCLSIFQILAALGWKGLLWSSEHSVVLGLLYFMEMYWDLLCKGLVTGLLQGLQHKGTEKYRDRNLCVVLCSLPSFYSKIVGLFGVLAQGFLKGWKQKQLEDKFCKSLLKAVAGQAQFGRQGGGGWEAGVILQDRRGIEACEFYHKQVFAFLGHGGCVWPWRQR